MSNMGQMKPVKEIYRIPKPIPAPQIAAPVKAPEPVREPVPVGGGR